MAVFQPKISTPVESLQSTAFVRSHVRMDHDDFDNDAAKFTSIYG